MTDERRRTAPKGARRLRRSPGQPHRTASGRLTGGTTPPCAALLAGTTVRAITAFQNGEDRPYGWAMKEAIPPTFPALFYGFVTTALYFVAASCIFPDEPDEWADLDAHFFRQRRIVLGGTFIANALLLASAVAMLGVGSAWLSPRALIVSWSLFPLTLVAMLARRRVVIVGALVWLILLYPLSLLW